jgi:hypothetical protein
MGTKLVTLTDGYQVAIDNLTTNIGYPNTDAFGRLRISSPYTLVQIRNFGPARYEYISQGQVSGSGTSFIENADSVDLVVGPTVGLRRLKSTVPAVYQNAKSIICYLTFCFVTSGEVGVQKRIGYLDKNNEGIYIEQYGVDSYRLVLKGNNRTPRIVNRPNWDNPAIGVDFTKSVIFWVNFEYLGVGLLICGIVIDGEYVVLHTFYNSNFLTGAYWDNPNKYLVYEIERTSAGTGSETLRPICASAILEGGGEKSGLVNQIIINSLTTVNLGSAGAIRPIALFKLHSNYTNARITVNEVITSITGQNIDSLIYIIRNPIITGYTPNWIANSDSTIEYDFPALPKDFSISNNLNSKDVVYVSYAGTNSSGAVNLYLTTNFNYTPVVYAVGIFTTTSNKVVSYTNIKLIEEC